MKTVIDNSTELKNLRAIFVDAGFDMWFVGGCVRDALMGCKPKDVDLATSATPEEQVAIYEANGIHFIPTGIQHGTVSVVLDEVYEITSLRTETDHDGRWATMAYTRDLTEDLSRRDLTINAIAMDFDGNIIDPFGGRADLETKRVRFVGNAEERMREDYLRILRFFRFHARIAGSAPLDKEAAAAIRKTRAGLGSISVERVWMEMSKIVSGPEASMAVSYMRDLALFEIIGMPVGFIPAFSDAQRRGVTDPASIMGWYVIDPKSIEAVAEQWKWSNSEWKRAQFVAENVRYQFPKTAYGSDGDLIGAPRKIAISRWKELLVDGHPFEWVSDLMRFAGVNPAVLAEWPVPKMPVTGRDLIEAGVKAGPAMGQMLKNLTRAWKDSDYKATKGDLVSLIEVGIANDP